MKTFSSIALLLIANMAFAKTSAKVDPTPKLEIQIANQSGLQFDEITLKPALSCWTTDLESGGESNTRLTSIEVPFRSTVVELNSSVILISFKVEKGARAEAPKKLSRFSSSRCGFGVVLEYKTNSNHKDSINGHLGHVVSRSRNANLTEQFVDEFSGNYVFKYVPRGEMYCPELGRHCSYCQLTLLKETSQGLREVGFSYETKRCSPLVL